MRRITKNSTLYELAPALVKEWHPSANGVLTPRNVKMNFSKKVWWICPKSHEWQATIKSRMNGDGCPLCAKDRYPDKADEDSKWPGPKDSSKNLDTGPKAFARVLELEDFDDLLGFDFRKSKRYKLKATAVLESPGTGHLIYADVKNFSAGGACFETDVCFTPGTKVTIKLNRPLLISDRTKYDSIIKWCKVMDTENRSTSSQRMGAEFI